MFNIKSIIAIFSLLLLSWQAQAQGDLCITKNTSFRDSEKLMFRVYYNVGFVWINAGNVLFTTKPEEVGGRKVYHITGDGRTAKSYVFFKVNDKYETYIDKETLLPVRFVRNVSEGGFKFKQDVAFNHKKGQAVSDKKTYAIPKCTQDVLSAIYFARNINYNNYKPGDKIPFNLFLDDKVYNLYIKYIGKEKIKTRMGTYNSIKIAPLLIEGTIFKGGDKMTVWVSDDENHLPLRVESPILVGSIKVDLMGFENLRNPFTSMVSKDSSD
ncbi:MAG: hypothetical protein JWQ38_3800 [Flavipsychrobacter sp.]|nr:hypothetical protein [Flavipsychrobacter sp.]